MVNAHHDRHWQCAAVRRGQRASAVRHADQANHGGARRWQYHETLDLLSHYRCLAVRQLVVGVRNGR